MNMEQKTMRAAPPAYAAMFPILSETAKRFGYALAIHGSMVRDFDLIAVPWTEEAGDPEEMIFALRDAVMGVFHHSKLEHMIEHQSPTEKPHGRMAWSIHLTNEGCYGPYLDISVMPRQKTG